MLNGKRMDELGFIIWHSGRIDTYGKRNVEEQKVLDFSISHMHSFQKQIGNTLLFKMLNIPFENYTNIINLSQDIAKKGMISFVNRNTFDINGDMVGYLFLPSINSSQQGQTLLTVLPCFADFTALNVYKYSSNGTHQSIAINPPVLKNTDELEKIITPFLTTNTIAKAKH